MTTAGAVQRIVADDWEGATNREQITEGPSEQDFLRLVRRLDGQRFTMLVLEGVGPSHMVIGGGDGRYVLYACLDGEEFQELVSTASKGDGTVVLRAGGQEGDYPQDKVVGTEQVVSAGMVYFRTGDLDRTQRWAPRY